MSASPSLVKIASTSASSSTATYKEELAEATTLDYDLIPIFLTAPGSTVSHSAFTAINTARVNSEEKQEDATPTSSTYRSSASIDERRVWNAGVAAHRLLLHR